MQLVIMAAGMGSRFGGLKQMEPMDDYNNFLLDYSIYDAKRAGFSSVVFIIKKEFYEAFRDTIGKRAEKIIKVEYAFQDLNDLPEGFKVPEGSKGKYAIVAFEAKNTMTENGAVKRGVAFKDEKGYLEKLIESSIYAKGDKVVCEPLDGTPAFETEPSQLVSMNLFCFNKDLIPALGEKFPLWLKENINVPKSEFLIPTVVDELVHENKATVRLLSTPSVWFGVTYKEDKPGVVKALKALVDKGEYKEGLY